MRQSTMYLLSEIMRLEQNCLKLQEESENLRAELNIRKSEKSQNQKGDDKHVNESTNSKQ